MKTHRMVVDVDASLVFWYTFGEERNDNGIGSLIPIMPNLLRRRLLHRHRSRLHNLPFSHRLVPFPLFHLLLLLLPHQLPHPGNLHKPPFLPFPFPLLSPFLIHIIPLPVPHAPNLRNPNIQPPHLPIPPLRPAETPPRLPHLSQRPKRNAAPHLCRRNEFATTAGMCVMCCRVGVTQGERGLLGALVGG